MVIHISRFVNSADTSDQGGAIFPVLKEELAKSEVVSISFAGINTMTSSFVNAALFPLLGDIAVSELKRRLRIVDSTRQINEMIKRCFDQYESIATA